MVIIMPIFSRKRSILYSDYYALGLLVLPFAMFDVVAMYQKNVRSPSHVSQLTMYHKVHVVYGIPEQ